MKRCPHCGAPVLDSHQFCPRCGGDLSHATAAPGDDPYLGMVIGGKFVLRELIGTGGMGKVYRSDQIGVGRTVAVKIMHRHLLGDETAAARFTNEARASSHLNHPHSIGVLDFGQTEVGILYIVMEYLRGRSLDAVLQKEFPIPFGRVASILCQAAEAVDAAHKLNIIHRDLKPENVFLEQSSGQDFVKVLDFGIAKMLDIEDRSITTPGLVPGTPEYMSPEQARGEALGPRSDVYSLGVILYELLTATVPFRGASALATMMSHVQDRPEPPSRRCPGRKVPEALDSIVLWALAKRVDERIPSAAQLRDILAAWAEVSGVWPAEQERRATKSNLLLKFFTLDQLEVAEPATVEVLPEATILPLRPRTRMPAALGETQGCFGREPERRRLEQFLASPRPGRTLRLAGEPGVGRSTLIGEAIRRAGERKMEIIHCRPGSTWTRAILGQVHRIALACLGIESSSGPEEILMAASRLGMEPEDIPGLKELFGLTGPLGDLPAATRRSERTTAFRHLVQKAAARRPLLIALEELEEFDAPSRELVVALMALPMSQPAAFIVSHGRTFNQLWPPEAELVELAPLLPEAARSLTRSLFEQEVDPELVEDILQHTGRQPLFIQQLVYGKVHEGISDPPERAVDLIAARVERLPQDERQLLQWMAVFGDWVAPATLSAIMGRAADESLLERLVSKGYLRPQEQGYGFVHRLLSMVVYSSIPAEVRRRIHQAVAVHLREIDAPVATIALHSFEAQDGPRAVEELDEAGASASRSLDDAWAVACFSRALNVVRGEWGKGRMREAELDRMAVDLARRLAEVLKRSGDMLAARGVLEETLSVAAGDSDSRAGLRLDLGRLDLELGKLERAGRHLELALADARASGADLLLAEISRELARAVGLLQDRPRATQLIAESLEASYRARAPRRSASWRSLLDLAEACTQIGFLERARGYLLDALQEAEKERSPLGKLLVISRMAEAHLGASEWIEAEMRLGQALELATQVGDRTSRSSLLTDLGRLYRIRGEVEDARKTLEQAVRVARGIGWWAGTRRAEQEMEMLRLAVPQAL